MNDSQRTTAGAPGAPSRPLTIAEQLGDDQPGAKVYDFSATADERPQVPPWAQDQDGGVQEQPWPVPPIRQASGAEQHWDAADTLLSQLGQPQTRAEAIALAIAHALLSFDLREAGHQ